jgi:TctA family transporter
MIFLTHPISAGLLALTLAILFAPLLWRWFGPAARPPR